MRRREFIAGLGSTAAWPVVARGQERGLPTIGWLHSSRESQNYILAFHRGLAEIGFAEGRNVVIEHRWPKGDAPALAAELVRRQVAVIVVITTALTAVAEAATQTLPIVFLTGGDPVASRLVASLNRPQNATGVGFQLAEITAKRLEMLHRLVPAAETIAFLSRENTPCARGEARDLQSAARILGVRLLSLNAGTESEIEAAFATVVERHVGALLISSGATFIGAPTPIISLAARHAIPTLFAYNDSVAAGGLSSYGPDLAEGFRQAGLYAGRILKGVKPSDLPVVQPTKFDLVINLKTAKALGLTIPPTVLALADEVIE